MNEQNEPIAMMSQLDDGTVVLTSANEQIATDWLSRAMSTYDPKNRQYSAYLNFSGNANDITQDSISTYAEGAQNNLDNLIAINNIIRKQINMDDILGMVIQAITNNINPEYRLSYHNFGEQRNKLSTLKKVKALVDDFNEQINIEQLICDAIELTYCEGNYVCLLKNNGSNWDVDYLPLGVAEISGYRENGRPIVLMNMSKLREALQKTMVKNKAGKPLFFKDTAEEIKANYPAVVYDAFKKNETYAKLDVNYTGVIRINNRSRKYGLSPIFRALSPMLTLQSFQAADNAGAKSKAKKIIHQVLRKEVLGPTGTNKGFDIMAYAHQQFMSAFANNTVVYTSPAAVEKIEYVESKVSDISSDKIAEYRNRVLTSLGISFLATDGDLTAASANISLKQLLQSINKISRQVEKMLENFYETLLTVNGYDLIYKPQISIIDSEMLEMNLRMDLAKLLYTTFACSRETSLGVLGFKLEDEKARREQENADNLSDIFNPYPTSFTTSGDAPTGRPSDPNPNDPDKQLYDETYNQTR